MTVHRSRSRLCRAAIATATVGLLAGHAHATATLATIDGPPDSFFTLVSALSDDGSTAVGSFAMEFGGIFGFRWTQAGGLEEIGTLPFDMGSTAKAVSADGSVIAGIGDTRGFWWTAADGLQELYLPPQFPHAYATALSANGIVAAGYSGDNAFQWINGGVGEGLTLFPTTFAPYPAGVSADGSVIVGRCRINPTTEVAWRWTAGPGGGTAQNLGFLPGNTQARANAVSANGAVVVGRSHPSAQAFRWTQTGGMRGLGVLPGCTGSDALAISADGRSIVGTCTVATGRPKAFLWTPGQGMVDLRSRLQSQGADVTGWDLTDARGISANGRVVVGVGNFNSAIVSYVAVLNPPCPGDADASGTVGVPDIFTFLAAWFAGETRADFDGSGGTPNVPDIFTFLAAWFAGCP